MAEAFAKIDGIDVIDSYSARARASGEFNKIFAEDGWIARRLGSKTNIVFYYSGHGVQSNGENFLIPIGADIELEYDIEDEAVGVRTVLGAMEASGSRLNTLTGSTLPPIR